MISELYQYRQLLKSNVRKEIRGKYKASFLGVLWSFVNPLLMTLVYAIVFPFLLRSSQPHYTTFIVIGILPWNWFTTSIAQGTNSILTNGGIIKKVYFPRVILPLSIVTSGLVNFIISCVIILIFLICSGIGFSVYMLYLPLIIVIQFILQLGIVLITSSVDVYVRDTEYIINFLISLLFYATPILYSLDMFPEKLRFFLNLNPVGTLVLAYKDIFYFQTNPNFLQLGYALVVALVILFIGIKVFNKLEKGFAEEL